MAGALGLERSGLVNGVQEFVLLGRDLERARDKQKRRTTSLSGSLRSLPESNARTQTCISRYSVMLFTGLSPNRNSPLPDISDSKSTY